MIIPGDEIPLDDSYDNDPEDQQSQEDIHSNGFDEEDEPNYTDIDNDADPAILKQAYDAAESSYTLDFDDEDEDDDE
jgi:hypothetical protein